MQFQAVTDILWFRETEETVECSTTVTVVYAANSNIWSLLSPNHTQEHHLIECVARDMGSEALSTVPTGNPETKYLTKPVWQ